MGGADDTYGTECMLRSGGKTWKK